MTELLKNLSDEAREVISLLRKKEEFIWFNPKRGKLGSLNVADEESLAAMQEAADRLQRFAPWIELNFPATAASHGLIESPLVPINRMKRELDPDGCIQGKLYLKRDDILPVSGSIKARGGIYEILKLAEKIALKHKLISLEDDYAVLSSLENKKVFSDYSVAVGSTGNLGLSVGIISAQLGFKTTVHMSSDARPWKKDKLRSLGVTVIEYEDDYSKAVAEGRKSAEADPNCHFVDDENSEDLFMGYSVAALRLREQLEDLKIKVDKDHPLFVYIPCGVGTGPGGVGWGLRQLYGENVYVFFAEPTQSPCVLLGLATGLHENISVYDIGLTGKTEADGLAVSRASGPVCDKLEPSLAGCLTVTDEHLYSLLSCLEKTEGIKLEPSALAGMVGPEMLSASSAGKAWLEANNLTEVMPEATHIVWATGGSMVPPEEMQSFIERGKGLKMTTIDDVPLLIRREIEALVLAPIIRAFEKEVGKEKTHKIVEGIIKDLAHQTGESWAERVDKNEMPEFVEHLLPIFSKDALDLDVKKVSTDDTSWDVTRCRYAEMYRKHGLEDLGFILSCNRDGCLFEGYNEDLCFTRNHTIMEGDDYCDFRIEKKDN
jgi:D-serine dehydratase